DKNKKIKPADYLHQNLKEHVRSMFKKFNANRQQKATSPYRLLNRYIETGTAKAQGKRGRPRKEKVQAKEDAKQSSEEITITEKRTAKQAGEDAQREFIEMVKLTLNGQERKLFENIGKGERTILVALGIQNRLPEVQKLILERTRESLKRKIEEAKRNAQK
ncbi:hypothetical protein HZC09_03955, partial [Candidatus Micrarchaeota archaeon]|nr:hypothetical protein [Candidatus Micrarchaeota archaeon]